MAGETVSISGPVRAATPHFPGPVLNAAVWTYELATGNLESNDVLSLGYVPAGATLIGLMVFTDDLDSATGIVSKFIVGSTDVVTGLTIGRAAGGSFVAFEPVAVTSDTLVKWQVTTVPTGAQAGTITVVPLYIGG